MNAGATIPPSTPLEVELRRLGDLHKKGLHKDTLKGAEVLLQASPENRDLLLLTASSLRHLMRIPEALAVLDRLERVQPRFSLLHQERGLCHVALKDAPRAIESLLKAVNINPALPMSWRMLEGVYRISGDAANAATAADHVATLKHLPPDIVTATSLFEDGDLDPSEAIIRAFLIKNGNHPDAMRLLARIGLARDVLDDAETLLEGVLALAPDYQAARFNYVQVLTKRHKYAPAREQLEQLLRGDPANREYRALAATIAVGLGEHEKAIALYRGMLAEQPASPDVHLWMGHALKTIGRLPEAIESYRAAAAARPDFGDAYWSLANLKTYRFADEEIARMRTEESAARIALADRYHLCFGLGKAFEDRGEIAESWTFYERGNALKREESHYRPDVIEANTRRQIEICSRDFFVGRKGWGSPRPDPIFIVGLPRSGSTLLEQILASHSLVEGTHELSDVQNIVASLQGRDGDLDSPRYPAILSDLTRDDFLRLGEKYLADTRMYRSGRPFFVDKMPNNFRHIGLMHLMLPNARIIDARREPMSCCFSNLKQLFAQGQEFSYSVDDIARYYRTYLELMEHWDEALPGRVLRVHHEDVVADLEGSVRRMLDYCGLEFETACIDFHKTNRSVRTPSSEQVRQPIFRDGLDHWKKYEPWLAPLKIALGNAPVRYRDSASRPLSRAV
jgi:tetratricopeptide (TPR) repeat protein